MVAASLAAFFRRPLCCLTLLWAAGIIAAAHLSMAWWWWALAAGVLLITRVTCWRWPSPVAMLPLLGAVVCLGAASMAYRSAPFTPRDLRYLPSGGVMVSGYPLADPLRTETGWNATFRLTGLRTGATWQSAAGDVYLNGHGDPPFPGHQYRLLALVLPAADSGNPYGFSWRAFLAERALNYRLRVSRCEMQPEAAPKPWLPALRVYLIRRLEMTMPCTYGPLYTRLFEGLLLGVHGSPLPDILISQFRRAGTLHLMIVSGSQVALLGGFLLFPFWLIGHGRARLTFPRARMLLLGCSLPILLLYVMLADRGPSIDRALLMGVLTTLSVFLGCSPLARARAFQPDGLTLLAAAAWIMLIANPALLFSAGVQLSFLAVFGLLTITPILVRVFPRIPSFITLPLAATLAAQLMTYPVMAWHFGTVPILGPLTNLLAIPIVGLLLPLGLLTLLFAVIAPPLAMALNLVNLPLLQLLVRINALASRASWAEIYWYVRSPWPILLYYLLLAAGILVLARYANARRERFAEVVDARLPQMW